jgi:hypothetical protein
MIVTGAPHLANLFRFRLPSAADRNSSLINPGTELHIRTSSRRNWRKSDDAILTQFFDIDAGGKSFENGVDTRRAF